MTQQKILSSQLSDSGVVPGAYTNSDVTVDSAGRITAISNGSSGSGTVTSVDISGGTTGLSFTGGPITSSGTITADGILDVANGGTSLATIPTDGQILIGDGAGYTLSTITPGTNISIVNAPGSITINAAASGGSIPYVFYLDNGAETTLVMDGSNMIDWTTGDIQTSPDAHYTAYGNQLVFDTAGNYQITIQEGYRLAAGASMSESMFILGANLYAGTAAFQSTTRSSTVITNQGYPNGLSGIASFNPLGTEAYNFCVTNSFYVTAAATNYISIAAYGASYLDQGISNGFDVSYFVTVTRLGDAI